MLTEPAYLTLPEFDPLPPLWPDEPPRVLIAIGAIPDPENADEYVRRLGRDGVRGKLVVVDCRRHRHANPRFVDRFVRRLFHEGAVGIDFAQPPERLWILAQRAAERIGTRDRVRVKEMGILRGLAEGF